MTMGHPSSNTYEENVPLSQRLDETIIGFQKGTEKMKEGEKRRLYIHPELAYGNQDLTKPNGLLILEIELVKALH